MNVLLLRGYNNYQNRWLKKKNTLGEYKDIVGSENYYEYSDHVNFNINDSVNTNITLNLSSAEKPDFMADYVIIHHEGVIKSRWFVLEQIWNRKDQYILTLKRDVLADFKEYYATAPMLVRKGYPISDTFEIYNSEGIQYSQIKKYQYDLGDSDLQWIVCYLNRNRRGVAWGTIDTDTFDKGNGYPAFVSHQVTSYYRYVESQSPINWISIDKNDAGVGDVISEVNEYLWIKSPVDNFGSPDSSSLLGDEAIERFRPLNGNDKSAYDIVVFPYSKTKNIRLIYHEKEHANHREVAKTFNGELALKLALNLKYTMQDDLYDIQLCPYCPESYLEVSQYDSNTIQVKIPESKIDSQVDVNLWAGYWKITEVQSDFVSKVFKGTYLESTFGLNPFTGANSSQCYGIYCDNFNRTITKTIPFPFNVSTKELKKVDSECRFIRLCSPTGKAMWDYNATKNGGKDTSFTINLTFKPGQPYMHIRPTQFGGIYGETFIDDTRGVVDTSSYSISAVIDSWMQYVQQNSNYQDIFNRQIESMEYQHNKQLISDIANAVTGTASGAVAGGMIGGAYGAIAGGAVSAVGGAVDVAMNIGLREEQLSLTKDLHNMNLAQIKARPDTLAKLSNIDLDSHLVPYVEIYSASDDEIEYLKNILKYRGYTINRIHKFVDEELEAVNDNLDSVFISGNLIECPDLPEDAHVFSEINNELMTGVRVFI